ncbi:MAG: YIP1 family protein [Myxococcota bacterium]
MNHTLASRSADSTRALVPTEPPPWDDVYLPESARWLQTIWDLIVAPRLFFRRVATDRLGGVQALVLVALGTTALSHAFLFTSIAMSAGSTLSAGVVFLEVLTVVFGLGAGLAALYVATIAGLSRLRGRRTRRVAWLRMAGFSSVPFVLAVVPVVGLVVGCGFALRAMAVALQTKMGFSKMESWLICAAPILGTAAVSAVPFML